jgi:hypothetical protein
MLRMERMGQLADFSLDQAAGACALVLGSLGGLLLICFRSRCTQISFLWGCYSCTRAVGTDDSDEEQGQPAAAADDAP